jgi:P-type conjugative transfer protein TrbG
MNRFPMLLLAPALGLGACAGNSAAEATATGPSAQRFVPAARMAEAPVVPEPVAVAAAEQPSARDVAGKPGARAGGRRAGSSGRHAAGQPAEPSPDRVQPWSEGSLYRLDTATERVSDIMLEPGETLISVAAGDTARWIIGETRSGSGAGRRTHVLVKPAAEGLATNLIIATDRRIYHVEAVSGARAATTRLSWTYPRDALLALQRSEDPAAPRTAGGARLNFGYSIGGDRPSWRPIRAYDDGQRVYIEFPASLGQGEAPPLFVRAAGGEPGLTNYRVRGRYYIVDRLFAEAELRLGEKPQKIVRIARAGAGNRGRGSGK